MGQITTLKILFITPFAAMLFQSVRISRTSDKRPLFIEIIPFISTRVSYIFENIKKLKKLKVDEIIVLIKTPERST